MATIKYTVFDKILSDAVRKGIYRQEVQKATKWFREKATTMGKTATFGSINADPERSRSKTVYGKMYMFEYLAKHRDTLPYWDKFPLIFPIGPAKGGFLGINFHYLPPEYRAKLLDSLYTIAKDARFTENQRLNITYEILNTAAKHAFFKPCVKHYLNRQVKSSFIAIDSTEWDVAIMLPTARFQKGTEADVWADSLHIGRRHENTFKRRKRRKSSRAR